MEDFPIYKDEDRLTSLAYYYEQLARYLLHSPQLSFQEWLNTRGLRHYDIEDYATAYVEVKGVSNTDQLKLFEDQLDFLKDRSCLEVLQELKAHRVYLQSEPLVLINDLTRRR